MNAQARAPDDENPYRSPAAGDEVAADPPRERVTIRPGIFRDGDLLVFTRNAVLPDICLRTDGLDVVRCTEMVYWKPSMFQTRYAAVILPLASHLVARRRMHQMISKLLFASASALGLASLFRLIQDPMILGPPIAMLMIVIAWLWEVFLAPPLVDAARITDQYIWLRGVHPDYLSRWPVFSGSRE